VAQSLVRQSKIVVARTWGTSSSGTFWGDESWRKAAYADHPQHELFGDPKKVKQGNEAIVESFRNRLKQVAGFTFVPDPLPMKNKNQAVVYYLFLASPKAVAADIIKDIFKKYR
jgi:three-Cys-motif partner protein